jgi:hypothetical protein
MKSHNHLLTSVLLVLFSTNLYANGYCDTRPSAQDRQRCYTAGIDMRRNQLNNIIAKFIAGRPSAFQNDVIERHNDWLRKVDSTCLGNASCVEQSFVNRISQFNVELAKMQKANTKK